MKILSIKSIAVVSILCAATGIIAAAGNEEQYLPKEIELKIIKDALTRKPYPPITVWLQARYEKLSSGPLVTLAGNTGPIILVVISPDGKTVNTVSTNNNNGTVKLWNMADGKELGTRSLGPSGLISSVAISPDGKTMAAAFTNTVKIWSMADGKESRTLVCHTGPIYSVAISPDSKTVVAGSSNGTVKIWNMADGKELGTLQGHTGPIHSVAISRDDKTVVTGSSNGTVQIWNVADGKELRSLSMDDTGLITSVAISPDGKRVVAGSSNGTAKIWNMADGALQRTLEGHAEIVLAVAISPDGKIVVTGSGDRTAKIWRMPQDLFTELKKLSLRQIELLQRVHAAASENRKFDLSIKEKKDEKGGLIMPNPETIIYIEQYRLLPDLIKDLVQEYVKLP